ncbi:MAG TPA: S1/P1 nuclease [Gemmatimonadales bacterium]|nr:S1/P1 nuclease [Gemmatimonadales bacterium]
MLLTALVASTLLAAPAPTPTPDAVWGAMGHRVIARVATARLSDRAKDEARRLLGGETLAKVATWADSIRRDRPTTGPWHYVNIPVYDSIYRPEKVCVEGCVVSAFEAQVAILADRARPDAERAEALKWVVHLVGDLHQPLHAGDRGDRGGNDVRITYDTLPGNLHGLWDTGLLLRTGLDENGWVALVERNLRGRSDLDALAGGTVVEWVMQAHDLSRDVVYATLPASLALDDGYLATARPTIEVQLERAAVRLATVLERSL